MFEVVVYRRTTYIDVVIHPPGGRTGAANFEVSTGTHQVVSGSGTPGRTLARTRKRVCRTLGVATPPEWFRLGFPFSSLEVPRDDHTLTDSQLSVVHH